MESPEEEPEPQLKYELLGGDVRDILNKERITCMSLSEKIVALGTEQGRIHVLDYSGNQVRLLNVHKGRVNDISFDKEAEHLASASNDGSVVVANLYTDQVTRHELRGPVKAVAIDPRPAPSSRRSWRDFVTGSAAGEVALHTQGWLGRSEQALAVAPSREVAAGGGVLALRWSGPLVAWAFESCVAVYDTTSHQLIRTLRRRDPRAEAAAAAAGTSTPSSSAPSAASSPAKPTTHSPAKAAGAAAAAAAAAAGVRGPAAGGAGKAARSSGDTPPGGPSSGGGVGSLKRCSLLFAPDSHLYVAWSDTILVARIHIPESPGGWQTPPQVELLARMSSGCGEAVLGVSPYGEDDLAVLVYPSGAPQPAALPHQQQHQQQQQPQPAQPQGQQRQEERQQEGEQQQPQKDGVAPAAEGTTRAADGAGAPTQEPPSSLSTSPAAAAAAAEPAAETGREAAGAATTTAASKPGAEAAHEGAVGSAAEGDRGSGSGGSGGDTAAAAVQPPSPPAPPPDPLAPGRTPQLVILSRSDHREWARDSVPLPAAPSLGPADFLGLIPSLPHHLHPQHTATHSTTTTTTTTPAVSTSAAGGTAAAARATRTGPATAAAGGAGGGGSSSSAASSRDATPRASAGGGAGSFGALVGSSFSGTATTASTTSAAATAAATSGQGSTPAPAPTTSSAPRRLVPVWVDGQELMFFIAAPSAIATARSRDAAERVGWLLARRRWEEALAAVEAAPPGGLPPGTYDRVVDGYIEELLTRQSYDRAVDLSERLLRGDPRRWERFVYLFAQVRQLPKLVERLPTDKPRLRPQLYDMALQSLLASPADHPRLLTLATRVWPPGCFSLAALADAVAGRLRRMTLQ
ncbi:hypothetical protein Agub_g1127, partial [Astrephomene gubernaculifera]